jgi:MFS family permease
MTLSGTVTMLSGGLVFPIFAPFVRTEFTAPVTLVGLAVSGYFLIRMFSEFPIGFLSDKIGPRIPLMIGRGLAIIGAFICYNTTKIWQLIIARALWGVGDAAFFCIGMSYITSLFPAEKRGRALGTFQAVEMVGSLLGQSLGGFLTSIFEMRVNFLISTILGGVAFLMVMIIKDERRHSTNVEEEKSFLPSKEVFLTVLNPTVILSCFTAFIFMMSSNGIEATLLPLYVTEEVKIPLTQFGIILASSTVGSVVGNVLGGSLSDRVGRKKILGTGFILSGLAIILFSVSNSFWMFIPVKFMSGISWGFVYGTIPVLVADSVSNQARGMGIGFFRSFFDFGGLVGPVLFSNIADFVSGYQGYLVAFYVGATLMIINLVFIIRLKE